MREHPEDRKQRLQSEKIAAREIDRFLRENPDIARELIGIYADEAAEQKLAEYREKFWAKPTDRVTRPAEPR